MNIPKWLADLGYWIHKSYYKQLFNSVYQNSRNQPSWFDHRIDLYHFWPENLFWLERGVLPRKFMKEGCQVLDLCCGDGFFSRYFYTTIASRIDAVDKDSKAIAHASNLYPHPNINFQVLDIVKEKLPQENYDLIVWFEAIEHLSKEEYQTVIVKLKRALKDSGILIGSTPIVLENEKGAGNWEHQNEFSSPIQLKELLEPDFENVQIDETVYPTVNGGKRRTAYFYLKHPK